MMGPYEFTHLKNLVSIFIQMALCNLGSVFVSHLGISVVCLSSFVTNFDHLKLCMILMVTFGSLCIAAFLIERCSYCHKPLSLNKPHAPGIERDT